MAADRRAAEAALWLLIGSICVGFNEEITTGGLLIVGGRGQFQREIDRRTHPNRPPCQEGPFRPVRLAEQLNLTPGGMTKVLNRLEDDRLIVRSHGKVPGDRRAVVIDLTADGEEVIAAIAAGLTSIKPEFRALFTTIAEHPENWSSARRQEIWTAPAAPADPNGPS